MKRYHTVLTIAGSDSGGGAGIQADIKTASACGCYVASVITALTAQNTQGVDGIHTVPASFVRMQAEAVLSDIGADAVKLGMLPTAEIVETVAEGLEKHAVRNVVLDPVMIATSGDRLISKEAAEAILNRLLPLARVVTPNLPEAEFMTGIRLLPENPKDSFREMAARLFDKGADGVLLKAGHLEGAEVCDLLFDGRPEKQYDYPYRKTLTPNTHGTGCTLSSAIASFLALGFALPEAVGKAEEYIHDAIRAGADYKIGHGHGGVHHFFKYWD